MSPIISILGWRFLSSAMNSGPERPFSRRRKVASTATISAPVEITASTSSKEPVILTVPSGNSLFVSPIRGRSIFFFMHRSFSTPQERIATAPPIRAVLAKLQTPSGVLKGDSPSAWHETVSPPLIVSNKGFILCFRQCNKYSNYLRIPLSLHRPINHIK